MIIRSYPQFEDRKYKLIADQRKERKYNLIFSFSFKKINHVTSFLALLADPYSRFFHVNLKERANRINLKCS